MTIRTLTNYMWLKTKATEEMKENLSKIKAFCIVVKGNETSEYYYNKIKKSWEEAGIDLERFDAITPETIPSNIIFEKYHGGGKYRVVKKRLSPTEKAVIVSHLMLWSEIHKKKYENNLIVEHDAMLENVELFYDWYFNKKEDVRLYGIGASCYSISPKASGCILKEISETKKRHGYHLSSGPMVYIAPLRKNNPFSVLYSFQNFHAKEHPVSHIYDRRIGNSINHYEGYEGEGAEEALKKNKHKDHLHNRNLWKFLDSDSYRLEEES